MSADADTLARTPICPLCGGDSIAWRGADDERDEFRCEDCAAVFAVRKEADR